MFFPSDAPQRCTRLLRLAERNPQRMARLVERSGLALSTPTDSDAAWTCYTVGWIMVRAERLDSAMQVLRTALDGFACLQQTMPQLHCRRALLFTELLRGGGVELQADWAALASAYEAQQRPADAAWTRVVQAVHLHVLGRPRDARQVGQQAWPVVEANGTLFDNALMWRVQGMIACALGEFDLSDTLLDRAASAFAEVRAPIEQAKCWLERGWNCHRRERFDAAERHMQPALQQFQRLGLPLNLAFCERSYGAVAMRRGQYDSALWHTLHARARFVALARPDQVAGCDLNIGNVAYYCGLFELAQAAYRTAGLTYDQLGMPAMMLMSRRNTAIALRAGGQPHAAWEVLAAVEAAVSDPVERAEVHFTQAQTLADTGAYDQAVMRFEQVQQEFMDLSNTAGASRCQLEVAWIHLSRSAYPAALACLRAAELGLADRPSHRWRIAYGLGRCASVEGDLQRALAYYRQAVSIVSQLRWTARSEHASSGVYSQAVQLHTDALLLATQRDEVAVVIELIEQQRALALQRQLLGGVPHLPPAERRAYDQQRTVLHDRIARAVDADDLESIMIDYVDLLLRSRHSTATPEAVSLPMPDLPALRAQLTDAYPAGWMVLMYAECNDDLVQVVLDQREMYLHRVPMHAVYRQRLAQATQAEYRHFTYLDLSYQRGRSAIRWAILTGLANDLLPERVRERLHPELRLLIVPAGDLQLLPWAALRVGNAFLCEQAVIQLVPALTIWPVLAARHNTSRDALLVGCSSFGTRAPALPLVKQELDGIADRWPGHITRLEEADAVCDTLQQMAAQQMLQAYRVIHIATHAQYVAAHGLLAHIKLWDDDLLVSEILQLGLSGALVVLSTCDGSASEVLLGHEVIGLNSAFLAAGASDVIANLWPASDRLAQQVLTLVYDRLLEGEDAPQALAGAQRTLIASAGDALSNALSPLTWAGLQVMGGGRVTLVMPSVTRSQA